MLFLTTVLNAAVEAAFVRFVQQTDSLGVLLNVESIFCVGILAPKPLGDPRTCQAWLPQEQIRPLVGPSETEILEALCDSVASEAWMPCGRCC